MSENMLAGLEKGLVISMKNIDILDAVGMLDGEAVWDARAYRRPGTRSRGSRRWVRWGSVAACLCLIIAGAAVFSGRLGKPASTPDGGGVEGGGILPGGVVLEGVDPVVASVAIFPAGKSLSDVADATLVSVDEGEAGNIERLGEFLPDTLPADCRYGPAGYYETTMKDGTKYRMIRVTYEKGRSAVPAPVPENAQSATEATGGTAFLWMVWGHRPDTDRPVFRPDEVSVHLLRQMNGGVFYIDYGGVYVGISQLEISEEELMTVIDSIGKR